MGNHTTGGESLSVRTGSQGISAQSPELLPLILQRDTVPETDTSVGPRAPRPEGVTARKENRHPQSSKAQDPSRGRQLSPCLFFWPCHWACRIKPMPPQWEHGTLTTGLPGEVPNYLLALKQGPYGPPCHRVAWFQLSERKLENAVN